MYKKDDIVAGHYLLIDNIDEGGQGTVWKAKDYATEIEEFGKFQHRPFKHDLIKTAAGKPYFANEILRNSILNVPYPEPPPNCAIKFLDRHRDKAVERLIEEYRASKLLEIQDDPRIIKLYDYDKKDRTWEPKPSFPWIAMEYIDGGNLSERIKNAEYKLKPHDSLIFFREIVEALNIAHKNQPQVLHRDLKPPNILIRSTGKPVIADFGICMVLDGERVELTTTSEVGSRNYIAPELRGEGYKVDPTTASDIYSLGKILYCMLSAGSVMNREDYDIGKYDLRSWDKASEGLDLIYDGIFRKTLTESPDDRLHDCEDLISLIDEVINEIST